MSNHIAQFLQNFEDVMFVAVSLRSFNPPIRPVGRVLLHRFDDVAFCGRKSEEFLSVNPVLPLQHLCGPLEFAFVCGNDCPVGVSIARHGDEFVFVGSRHRGRSVEKLWW